VALAALEERAGQLQRVAEFQAEQLGTINPEVMGEDLRRAIIEAAPEDEREDLAGALAEVNFTSIALGTLEEQLFERTERAISERFSDHPLLHAQLLETQATTLSNLGLPAEAVGLQEEVVRLRRSSLGEDDARMIRATAALGALYCDHGRGEEGEPLLRDSLARSRRVLGEDDRQTIETLNALGGVLMERGELAEAEAHVTEALERSRRVMPEDDAETLRSLNNLATLRQKQGRFDDAVALQAEAAAGAERAIGRDEWPTMVARNNLATLLFQLGRLGEAEPQFREVLRTRRRMLGDEHPDTLLSINNLGVVLERLGALEEAQALHLEAYEGRRRRLGADHAFTLSSLNNLGSVYKKRGLLSDAEACYRGALEGLRGALGDEHPYTLMATGNLAGVMMMRGDHAGAVRLLGPAVELGRRVWTGENTRIYATMLADLGAARGALGAFEEGEASLLEAHALLAEVLGADHASTRSCAGKLAALYETWHAADPAGGHDAAGTAWRAKAE
jgi:non-specific serine/threonine protein kinase/serine/threonine-protein kinase